jgi:hypothetical protein
MAGVEFSRVMGKVDFSVLLPFCLASLLTLLTTESAKEHVDSSYA